MLIYFLTIFTVTGSAFLAQRAGNVRHTTVFFCLVSFSTMVLVAGFRAASVGTDTFNYTSLFEQSRYVNDGWQGIFNEPGYSILSFLTHVVSDQYWALLLTIAAVVIFSHMIAIYNISVNPAISLFVFIAMGYFTFFFNGARQGIAFAIYTLAFRSLIDGNFKKYAFWVIIAFLFHKTVIIALPLYFLFRQKSTLTYFIQMVIGATIVVLFFNSFLDLGTLFSDRYSVYQEIESAGGRFLTLFYLLLSVFFMYYRSAISASDRVTYDYFLNMLIFGSTIYIVITFSGGYVELTRLAIYFQIATIFLWPIVYKNIRKHSLKYLFNMIFFVGHIAYFYIFINKIGGLVPYRFNEEIIFKWLQ